MKISDDNFANIINNTLKNGGVIAFVTDTVWGIGCLPDNENGVKKIYEIKKRDTQKPLILMSNKKENLYPYIKEIPEKAQEMMKKHFPGGLTIVLEKSDKTKEIITSGKETVGIRIPNNKIFQKLCNIIEGNVLATTSANISGEEPALDYQTAFEKLNNKVDIIVENEEEKATGEASTVIGFTKEQEIQIFRQGKVRI